MIDHAIGAFTSAVLQVASAGNDDHAELRDTILAGLIGVIGGYGVALWRNRTLPLITILEFDEYVARRDFVDIPAELSDATMQAWLMLPLQKGSTRLGEAFDAMRLSKYFLEVNRESRAILETSIERLETSTTNDERRGALLLALRHDPVKTLLEGAVNRTALAIPTPDTTLPQHLLFSRKNTEEHGCFALDFPSEVILIGSGFSDDPIFEHRLLPVLQIMSQLDAGRLVQIFTELIHILRDQTDYQRIIAEASTPIVEPRTRWSAQLKVSNYGSAPFVIIASDPWIGIRAHGVKPIHIDCKLATWTEQNGWVDVLGGHVIPPGYTEQIALIARATQQRLSSSEMVRALWKSGSGYGHVNLRLRGRELPWSSWESSYGVPFSQAKTA